VIMAFNPNNFIRWSPLIPADANTLTMQPLQITPPPPLPQYWAYQAGADTQATVEAAGYFRYFANYEQGPLYNDGNFIHKGDLIYCVCSDGSITLIVTAVTPVITTGAPPADIAAGTITTAMLGANIVTAAKIANGAITTTQINAAAGIVGTQLANGTITATQIASDAITTAKILNANVTLAKLAAGITPSHVIKFAGQPTTVGGAAAEAFVIAGVLTTDLAFVQIVDNGTANVTALQAVCTANTLTVTFSADPGNDTIFNYQIIRAAA
jgi:hypothetical protein